MSNAALAFAWFPAGEFEAAVARWPDLMDEPIADHSEYCVFIERQLRSYGSAAEHGFFVAPIVVDELIAWSEEHGVDPGVPEARAEFAAELAKGGDVLPWPPGRNELCWCGSAQKYKWCCGRSSD